MYCNAPWSSNISAPLELLGKSSCDFILSCTNQHIIMSNKPHSLASLPLDRSDHERTVKQ